MSNAFALQVIIMQTSKQDTQKNLDWRCTSAVEKGEGMTGPGRTGRKREDERWEEEKEGKWGEERIEGNGRKGKHSLHNFANAPPPFMAREPGP